MPKFEQAPLPPTEPRGPEGGESPEQAHEREARGILARLDAHIARWRTQYGLTVGVVIGLGTAGAAEAIRKRLKGKPFAGETVPGFEGVHMDAGPLRELDPEMTPERLRFILSTYPEGFVDDEVSLITYRDEHMASAEKYGIPHGKTAAQAEGGTGAERVVITFFKGSQDQPSSEIWGETLGHELGHAGDWVRDKEMSKAEREAFQAKVRERVQADDRYLSGYVESINNKEKEKELDIKAEEYWAEIFAAYLAGQSLPEADKRLVLDRVAMNDPDFDREEALRRRRAVLSEMAAEETLRGTESLEVGIAEAHIAWLRRNLKDAAELPDEALREAGRAKLVEALRAWGTTDERRQYARELLDALERRERLLEEIMETDLGGVRNAAFELALAEERLDRRLEAIDDAEEAAAFRDQARVIVDTHDVVLGDHRGQEVTIEEMERLGIYRGDGFWIRLAASWEQKEELPSVYRRGWEQFMPLEWLMETEVEGLDEPLGDREKI
jgi:hypothetical protein